MNGDILRKIVVHMDRKAVSVIHGHLSQGASECIVSIMERYRRILNTFQPDRLVTLLEHTLVLERYDLTLDYLSRITPGKTVRVLHRLSERMGVGGMKHLHDCLKNVGMKDVHSDILLQIECIMNSRRME